MGLPCGSTLEPPPIRCRNLLREISKVTLPFYHGLDNAYKGVLTQIFRYTIKNKAIFTFINHCHNKNLNLLKSHQLSFQWRSTLIPNSPLKCVNFLPSMLHCTYHVASIEPPRPRLGPVVGVFFCAMRVHHSILLSLSIISYPTNRIKWVTKPLSQKTYSPINT